MSDFHVLVNKRKCVSSFKEFTISCLETLMEKLTVKVENATSFPGSFFSYRTGRRKILETYLIVDIYLWPN